MSGAYDFSFNKKRSLSQDMEVNKTVIISLEGVLRIS